MNSAIRWMAVGTDFFVSGAQAMSPAKKKPMIRRDHPELSCSQQCRLVKLSRSAFYYAAVGIDAATLALMKHVDRLFTRFTFFGKASFADQLRKDRQGVQAHMRHIDPTKGHTCDPVKHSCWDFQEPVRPAAGKMAAKHRIAGCVDRLMDVNRSTKPGVPSIKNLAALGNVGVLAFSCITPSGPIAPLRAERRTTHTGPIWKSKKQHET